MMDWLTNSIQDNTVIWLVISSLIGGIIGSTTKLIFDVLIPQQIKSTTEIINIKRKYGLPIFYSSLELTKRLESIINLIQHIEQEYGWLQKDAKANYKDDYYFLSTVYLTAQLFAWIQILRRTVIFLDLVSVKETRLYSFAIDAIMACFSNPALLSESAKSDPSQSEDKWIFSIWIQTIGNIMITKDGDELKVIDYSTFYRYVTKLDKTPPVPDFIEWTKPLTLFFDGIKSSGVRFHRIIALHEVLCAFIELYDPKNIRGAKRPSYWELLHKQEQKHIGELILKFNPQYKPLK